MKSFTDSGFSSGWRRLSCEVNEIPENRASVNNGIEYSARPVSANHPKSESCVKCFESQAEILGKLKQLQMDILAIRQIMQEIQEELLEAKRDSVKNHRMKSRMLKRMPG